MLLALVMPTAAPVFFLAVVGGWFVYQAATLYVGAKLLRLVARWRARRRARRAEVATAVAEQ